MYIHFWGKGKGLSKRAPEFLSTTQVDSFHARETLHDVYCDDDLCQSASPYLGHYHPTLQKVESLLDYENLVEETRSAAKEHLYPTILYPQSKIVHCTLLVGPIPLKLPECDGNLYVWFAAFPCFYRSNLGNGCSFLECELRTLKRAK